MKRFVLLLTTALPLLFSCGDHPEENTVPEEPIPNEYGFYDDDMTIIRDTVRSGETFGEVMEKYGVSAQVTSKLISLGKDQFDVRRFRAGNPMEFYRDSSETTVYVVYRQNKLKSTVFHCQDSLAVWSSERPVSHEKKISDIIINTSLWDDMIAAGASPELIVGLSDIFQWSVNFFAMQKGDRFRAIYTQSVCDGEVISVDTVFFCLYSNADGKETGAMRYEVPGISGKYWGKNGEGMKKMFLKAPLKFNRISSRFSYHRRHPVTGKVRPHTAVDYAAPKGTPVYALGDGKITLCGWDGSGGGNRIKIKHAMGYETCYMHLSKFAAGIKAGRRVSQGELIGYVGSTGRSTGPHLDFRIWLNGKPLDPLKVASPNTDPLPSQYLDDFNAKYNACLAQLPD